jgi:hypothetical protein
MQPHSLSLNADKDGLVDIDAAGFLSAMKSVFGRSERPQFFPRFFNLLPLLRNINSR